MRESHSADDIEAGVTEKNIGYAELCKKNQVHSRTRTDIRNDVEAGSVFCGGRLQEDEVGQTGFESLGGFVDGRCHFFHRLGPDFRFRGCGS